MKLPNGYGSVRKLSGNRRRPYMVEKTETWLFDSENNRIKQKRVTIGYYATRAEALQALANYNTNPYNINAAKITFAEVYELWSKDKFLEISENNIKGYKASYKICGALYNMPFKDIKLNDLQAVADNSGKHTPTLRKYRVLLSQLYAYAVIHEIISEDKNMVKYLNINKAGNPNAIDREPFTDVEIKKLWEHVNENIYLQIPLMLIYSGVRISELLELKKCNVHLEERYFFIEKSKTPAGVRPVPIADKTFSFFEYWFNKFPNCETLLATPQAEPLKYANYKDGYFTPLLSELGLKHKPHDTRHTCISLLAAKNVNPTVIKKIVGHAGAQSLTERIYTHFDIEELLNAINQI